MGIRSQNNPIATYLDVFATTGLDASANPAPGIATGISASGGIIGDFVENGDVYRAHVFTTSGSLVVESVGDQPAEVEYLVVGGGGAGGAGPYNTTNGGGGGGGAGGLRSTDPGVPSTHRASAFTASAQTYPVVIGAGGNSGQNKNGTNTTFGPITVQGGGGANVYEPSGAPAGANGGSGGGGSAGSSGAPGVGNGGAGAFPGSPNPSPVRQGYPGGTGYHVSSIYVYGGGGGGASEAGTNAPGSGTPVTDNTAGDGGDGYTLSILGPGNPFAFGGGGGGGAQGGPNDATAGNGGLGGGGAGASQPTGTPRTGGSGYSDGGSFTSNSTARGGNGGYGTGGGGGGAGNPAAADAGNGGSGIVVARYKIALSQSGTAKATGGDISFYGDKVIHTFLTSDTFVMPAAYPSTPVQVLVVAGGGAGGGRHGGGGGAGGLIQLPAGNGTITNGTYTVVVGAGGANAQGGMDGGVGGNSSFGPPSNAAAPTHLLALGGGAGKSYPGHTGTNSGGSSGGMGGEPGSMAGSAAQPAPTVYGTSTGHGNAGNTGTNWNPGDHRLGGGGGGAGGAGVDGGPSGPQTGNGGVGLQVQIAGDPNNNYFYAGGGGGGTWAPGTSPAAGDGGQGGGGGGSTSNTPTDNIGSGGTGGRVNGGDGTSGPTNTGGSGGTNTGGGGGGNGQSSYSTWPKDARGGAGGSGIVIIAYPAP